ncbi:hypothetical protein ACFYSJ_31170 [Streptomyces sp. NPDC005248]|uniref:hypothetical protein n=1 Tax=Streptomyces sp. NPDC005248 TaxID=3364709 RepID=UPI003690F00F
MAGRRSTGEAGQALHGGRIDAQFVEQVRHVGADVIDQILAGRQQGLQDVVGHRRDAVRPPTLGPDDRGRGPARPRGEPGTVPVSGQELAVQRDQLHAADDLRERVRGQPPLWLVRFRHACVRAISLRAERLIPAEQAVHQLTLDTRDDKARDLEAALDLARARYGPGVAGAAAAYRHTA